MHHFAATISLNADKLSAKTTSPAEVVNEAYFPLWFSNGSRVLVGLNNTPNDVFNVFPNPFDESITIKFKDTFVQNEVKIIDLTGKVLYNFTSDSQQLTVNLNFLPTGTYVLKAGTAVQKIIKF